MRRTLCFAAVAAVFILPATGWCRQSSQADSQASKTETQTSPQSQAAPAGHDSLAEAARRAREQRKDAPKAAKVFTNDDLPSAGGISTVGETSAAGDNASAAPPAAASSGNDEKTWRDKFAQLRHKLEQDQAALAVMQREIGVAEVQYYNGNPTQAMQDQTGGHPLGTAYTKKMGAIEAKKKEIEADQQAISDAEDALHKAGGEPGWAR